MPTSSDNSAGSPDGPGSDRLCRLEFLVEPFTEGQPGPHVLEPLENLRSRGIKVHQGPFGNTVEGDRQTVTTAILTILQGAFDKGASRILINLAQGDSHSLSSLASGEAPGAHPPGAGEKPVGGQSILGPQRPADLHGAVDRLVAAVEVQLGGTLGELSREKKQAAVRILDSQGVFLIRKSVEAVAEAMGVSRITIYNYLNAIRGD